MRLTAAGLIICTWFFIACGGGGGGGEGEVIVTSNTPAPEVVTVDPDDDNDPLCGIILIGFHAEGEVRFYDSQKIVSWKTGDAVYAGNRSICHGTTLYRLDQQGRRMSSKNILSVPDFAAADGDNIWLAYNMTAVESADLGATPRAHTRIYYNATEYGDWMTREFQTSEFLLAGSNLMAYGVSGGWRNINGALSSFRIAIRDGFVVHDFDHDTHTAKIDGVAVSWSTNYFNSANFWLKSGSVWYSQNGYTWDGATLTENGSALTCWRQIATYPITLPEGAVVISAGVRVENEEPCLYWIECNSGWVFRYVPSTNALTAHIRIYTGDGYRSTGLAMAAVLKPVIVSETLFFNFTDGQMYKVDLLHKQTTVLGPAADWIAGWQ